jgi:Ser/Thr protein kinase RdoA (MazF antagonist)
VHDVLTHALACFGYAAQAPPTLIGAGTLNHNYFVQTNRGEFVLRRIRDDQPDASVAIEHETIRWIAARGVPVPLPSLLSEIAIATETELPPTCVRLETPGPNGATEMSRWVLFPFVEGRRVGRDTLAATEAATLGDAHGRLHALLREHPRSRSAKFGMQWSAQQSAAMLERVEAVIRSNGATGDALEGVILQRRLLDAYDVRAPVAFDPLPCQWLHGDFHVDQVLFGDASKITAILDWELCQSNARVWELVRSLAFSGLLDGHPNASSYLRSYRRHVPIDRDELDLGLSLWWQSRVVGVWIWWAAFVQGNARVHAFIPDTVATLRRIAEPGWRERVARHLLDAV